MGLRHIHVYEMPEESQNFSFQLYEVQGKTIRGKTYPHKTELPHRHSYYEICIFANGAGRHEIDFQTYPIASYSIHFLTPGQVHLISSEKDYHGYLMVFKREFYPVTLENKDILFELPFFNNPSISPILELNKEDFSQIQTLIDNIKSELVNYNEYTPEILRSYLHIFLLKCKNYFDLYRPEISGNDDIAYKTASKFRYLVEQHFSSLHFVSEYADMMALTSPKLNKTVNRMTGYNASDVITNRIVLEAKRLLTYTELTNKEVAFRLGYEDPSYFSRIFKNKTGDTPSEFKNKMNKKYQK